MIRFFRHIRQSLLLPDSTRKYLIYALGEILLVMIGILLALQVNNWNEERIKHQEENRLLENLLIDLREAHKEGQQVLIGDSTSHRQLEFFLYDKSRRDSLMELSAADSVIMGTLWDIDVQVPVIPAYEDIKNSGTTGLISNQEIRNQLAVIDELISMLRFQIGDKTLIQQDYIDGLIAKNLRMSSYVSKTLSLPPASVPGNSFPEVISNQEFFNRLSMKLIIGHYVLNSRRELQKGLLELISLIEAELN